MKTVFILSGGGALGAFEVGALKFLLEPSNSIRPDVIVGTSVGSLNGAKLAESPDIDGVKKLEQIWRGIKGKEDIYKESDGLAYLNNLGPNLLNHVMGLGRGSRLLLFGGLVDPLFVASGVAALSLSLRGEVVSIKSEFESLAKDKCLYRTDPFWDNFVMPMLEPRYSEWLANVQNAHIKFRAVLISIESGDLVYVSETGQLTGWGARVTKAGEIVRERRDPMPNVSLARAVLASASEPIINNPVTFEEIRDEHFYDGGMREIAPTQALFDPEAGLNLDPSEEVRAFVVCASLFGIKRWPSDGMFDTKGIVWPMEGSDNIIARTFDIVLNETLLNDVEYAQLKAPENWKVTTISATHFVHDSMTFIPDLLAINMGHGYTRACDVLRNASGPFTDLTDLLVTLDLELYERVKRLMPAFPLPTGIFRVYDLIREAYKYWKDRDVWLRDHPAVVLEEHVTFALQKVKEVSAVIGGRRRANLPATSLAWECIGSFEYDWPEAQPQLLNPQISVLPSGLDFGQVLICGNHPKRVSLTIRNTGAGLLIITSFQIDGGPFSTPLPAFAVIKPNDTFSVMVHFAPTSEGLAQGALNITSDDHASPTITVQLKGTGIRRPVTVQVDLESRRFGRVFQNREYTADFTLQNLGSEPLIILEAPSVSDPDFSIEEYPQRIECLDTGLIRIKFMVSDQARHQATIRVPITDLNHTVHIVQSFSVEATGSPEECEELSLQLAALKEDLARGEGDPSDLLQQIHQKEEQMQQLGCPSE